MALTIDFLSDNDTVSYYTFKAPVRWPNTDKSKEIPQLRVCDGDIHEECLPLTLYRNACGHHHNCTESCQNASIIFSSMEDLHNCIMYPTISSIVSTGNLSQKGLEVANFFGITGDRDENIITTSKIKQTVNGCMDDYCNSMAHACRKNINIDIPIGYSNGLLTYNNTIEVRVSKRYSRVARTDDPFYD